MSRKSVATVAVFAVIALVLARERSWFAGEAADRPAAHQRAGQDRLAADRHRLAELVGAQLANLLAAKNLGAADPRVISIMRRLPRHRFVPQPFEGYAYDNRPLPVGYGQTESQPFIVALMSQLAEIRPGNRVLLVGVGGGYQAALMSELGAEVYCVELFEPVAREAEGRFAQLGYPRISVKVGDGFYGWQDEAPFDAIVVRQAAQELPPPLTRQLGGGGRMVMPVGRNGGPQDLVLATRMPDDSLVTRKIIPVRFTSLPGGPRI